MTPSGISKLNLCHIINPVAVGNDSRFHFVQQVTFQTMEAARNHSSNNLEIEFLSVQYQDDREILPSFFNLTPNLIRSVLDYGDFQPPRKLPLLEDILATAVENSKADYFIYTNVDIGVLPYFYQTLASYIFQGYDAFTINRRSISDEYQNLSEIPLMYAEIGEPHRGWDCFVFKRNLHQFFRLGTICIGAPLVGLVFIANLIAHSNNFHQFTQEHLTFHLGNERFWAARKNRGYAQHNRQQALAILQELESISDRFPRQTPPGRYLLFNRNSLLSFIYSHLMKLDVPVRYTRKSK